MPNKSVIPKIFEERLKTIRKIDVTKLQNIMPNVQAITGTPCDLNTLLTSLITGAQTTPRTRKSKPWFYRECYQLYMRFRDGRRLNAAKIHELKSNYKKICQEKQKLYHIHREERLIETAQTDRK